MKIKTINFSDIANHPNLSLSARDYIYDYKVTIHARASLVTELQRFLDLGDTINIYKEKIGKNELLHTFTAKFENGFEADIKVYASETGCYIDPVMFDEQGNEICILDTESELVGDYIFEVDGKSYLVDLIIEETEIEKENNSKLDYSLESKLSNLAYKFQNLEVELLEIKEVWDLISTNYSGHPLSNIDEFVDDVKDGIYKGFK